MNTGPGGWVMNWLEEALVGGGGGRDVKKRE